MTMPKAKVLTAADVPLIRWSIAYAYALGANMMVPWDIYLPTPNAMRYYGSAANFSDLAEALAEHMQEVDQLALAVVKE